MSKVSIILKALHLPQSKLNSNPLPKQIEANTNKANGISPRFPPFPHLRSFGGNPLKAMPIKRKQRGKKFMYFPTIAG